MPRAASALGFALVLTACATSNAPPTSPRPAPLGAGASTTTMRAPSTAKDPREARVDTLFADFGEATPGCSVGVFRAGEVLLAKGYGQANLENHVPITPDTVFELASVSKQFTAAAIFLLAGEGKLTLDDDIRTYIPDLRSYARPIVLRHLLGHTGGLREYDSLLDLSGYDTVDVATEPDILHLVMLQRGTNFPAGTAWSYSNTGYFLLGQVVAKVSGKSLAEFSRERIFAPLGMKDTSIFDDHTKVIAHRASGYAKGEHGYGLEMSNREATGEGNIQTTVRDLARWDANFYDPKVGGSGLLAAMRTPAKLSDGKPTSYGGGLVFTTVEGRPVEEHSGGWAGYRTFLGRFPDDRLSVAVLCNDRDADGEALAHETAAIFLPEPKPGAGEPSAKAASVPSTAPTAFTSAELAALAGAYVDRESLTVRRVLVEGSGLSLRTSLADDGPARPLERLDAHTLRVKGTTTKYQVLPSQGKVPARLVRETELTKTTLEKLIPTTATEKSLMGYSGRYRSEETTHDLGVALDEKKTGIVFGPWGRSARGPSCMPLDHDLFVDPTGGGLRFERDGSGKVTGLVSYFDGHPAIRWKKVD